MTTELTMSDDNILFRGFSLKAKNFKCVADEAQGFDELRRINVIIGRNNSGKSALIDLVAECVNWNFEVASHLWHGRKQPDFVLSSEITAELAKARFPENTRGGELTEFGSHWNFGKNLVGARVSWERRGAQLRNCIVSGFKTVDPFQRLSNPTSKGTLCHNIAASVQNPLQGICLRRISAERDICPESDGPALEVNNSGVGATNIIQNFLNQSRLNRRIVEVELLKALNDVFSPDGLFTRILVQQLGTGGAWEVFLEETFKEHIALSQSGSGLKTIILVLINLLLVPHSQSRSLSTYAFAFEELENNLHPALLRRLLGYITEKARAEKFIVFLTTHSSTTIDFFAKAADAQIIHVRHNGTSATATRVTTYVGNKSVLDDLDVRASDVLQANCVIWVEGPSDRYYINRWLNLWSNGELTEGVHYQCVFYGGRLLKHIDSTADKEASGVQILRLSRHACILMDSDKRDSDTVIGATKKRIAQEIKSIGGFAWITAGREIENYIPSAAFHAWKQWECNATQDPYRDVFEFMDAKEPGLGKKFRQTKPDFAEEISPHLNLESCKGVLDWESQMKCLHDFIIAANGQPD